MPWVTYPVGNSSLTGIMGDGILFAIFLVVSLSSNLLRIFTSRKISSFLWYDSLVAAFLFIVACYKVVGFEKSIENYDPQTFLHARAAAGVYLDYGFYLFLISSFLFFITALARLVFARKKDGVSAKSNILIGIIVLGSIALGSMIIYLNYFRKADLSKDEIQVMLVEELGAMSDSYKGGFYEDFAKYSHPILIKMLGGQENYIDIIKKTKKSIEDSGAIFSGIKLVEIEDFVSESRTIQAVIKQKVVYTGKNGKEIEDVQRLITISYDKGKSWKFIEINNRTKHKLKEYFLEISDDLDF